MIQHNEIVMLLLGVGVFVFSLMNHRRLKGVHAWNILVVAYAVVFAAWCFTVIEGFFWKELFNYFEHIFYTISSILVMIWCWRVLKVKETK